MLADPPLARLKGIIMVAYTDALARWREYHDVVTHVARCQCDECETAREDAAAESLVAA